MAHRLGEVAALFLKLGSISFGGPAVHLALMEHEVVRRRGWLSHERFVDLFAATHLIPGPNGVEMASHIGYQRAGLLGSLTGGLCFTLPAVLITVCLAVGYARWGTLPQVEPFLHGFKPAVLAVIFTAGYRLGKKSLGTWRLMAIGVGVGAASLAGYDEVLALLVGSLIGVVFLHFHGSRSKGEASGKPAAGLLAAVGLGKTVGPAQTASVTVLCAGTCAAASAVSLWKLGLFFLKIGAVLYGGGYVLLAYIEGGLVQDYGWLTQSQLLDAVAIGQFTPGPMLSTATFVGYLVAGLPGAAVATVGILLPSFCFVAIVNPLLSKLRSSYWAGLFLDAVGAASIGLMGAVVLTFARATLFDQGRVDWPSCLIALIATVAAVRWKVAPAWLMLAGALAGRLLWGW